MRYDGRCRRAPCETDHIACSISGSHFGEPTSRSLSAFTTDETVIPDPIAYQDDTAQVADVLEDSKDNRTPNYAAQLLGSVARSANDHNMLKASEALAARRDASEPTSLEVAQIIELIQQRLTERIAI